MDAIYESIYIFLYMEYLECPKNLCEKKPTPLTNSFCASSEIKIIKQPLLIKYTRNGKKK